MPALNGASSHICAHPFVGHLTKQGRIFFFFFCQACFAYKETEFASFLLRLWSVVRLVTFMRPQQRAVHGNTEPNDSFAFIAVYQPPG